MAQSVELLLDASAEAAIRRQWDLLAEAGLPSERRSASDLYHRPHVTLFASDAVPAPAEDELPGLVADLELELRIGVLMIFGPRRRRCILVRQVTASVDLLALQSRVAAVCAAEPDGQFGAGRWSPHVTLARRLVPGQLGSAVDALDETADRLITARVIGCRRWDGARKTAWLL